MAQIEVTVMMLRQQSNQYGGYTGALAPGSWSQTSPGLSRCCMHLGILTYGVAIVTMSLHDISIICTNFYGIIMAVPCDDNFVCVAPLVGM